MKYDIILRESGWFLVLLATKLLRSVVETVILRMFWVFSVSDISVIEC